ncbi:MAG: GNAT family N-acetyltransferase [Candidatus Electryoneaceae bacterium]|nr:GNAT family N-acetyltransferase [Candidatus Electryoneaceae bacterium]
MLTLPDEILIIRARDQDLPEMARLHYTAYPGIPLTLEQRIENFRSDPRISLEDRWVCLRKDRLVGMFNLYNFQMYRSGELIPVGGIGGVAVSPEARREKIAYWMMMRAVRIMDKNGSPLSLLYPFRHNFYHRLGWGLIGRVQRYRFDPRSLPAYTDDKENVCPVTTSEDQEEVMSCYNRFAEKRNGLLRRDDPTWFETVFKNETCYAYRSSDSGKIEGYILFKYKPLSEETDFLDSDMSLREFVWTNQRSFRGLIGFLSAQRDQIRTIIYHDQSGLPFERLLTEPIAVGGQRNMPLGAETATVGSNLMGRIIQLRRALAVSGIDSNVQGKVTLKITDDLNPKNSEPLTVEFDNGKIDFPRNGTAPLMLLTDIATFSAIYWGSLRLPEAIWLGLVEIDGKGDIGFFDRALGVPHPICLDYF